MVDSAHTGTTAPAISGVIDLDGTEYGAVDDTAPSGSVRSFRAATVTPTVENSGPTDTSARDTLLAPHLNVGQPDSRRDAATMLPAPAQYSELVDYSNQRREITMAPEAAPDRARQGFTGQDPTRPSLMIRPLMMRLFDKGIADHPIATKIDSPSPLASRPKDNLSDVPNGQANAGGIFGTQHAGVGPQPNSFRIMPKEWDTLLVNTGGPAVSPSNPDPAATVARAQAARNFRL